MQATINFTSSYITNPTALTALDATSAYQTRDGSCTAFANLASAVGRALGVPTRHLANILVGMSQDMHSISEFYLGPQLGWRRVEPQQRTPTVPEDYVLAIATITEAHEGTDALLGRKWVMPGAPRYEFTESVDHDELLEPVYPNHFGDCDGCSNRADPQATLRGDVTSVFAAARTSWQSDRVRYLAGNLPDASMNARRAFLTARSLSDVSTILSTLPQ
jgi:hypothetical protein